MENKKINIRSVIYAHIFLNLFGYGYFKLGYKIRGAISIILLWSVFVQYMVTENFLFQGIYFMLAVATIIDVAMLAKKAGDRR